MRFPPSVLTLLVLLAAAPRARAATLTVTSADDAGPGTLRDAITQANDEGANPGLDTIVFAVPSPGVPVIVLATGLPSITSPAVVDGTTQAPAGAVRIDGNGALNGALVVQAGAQGTTLRGLVVTGFTSYGIQLVGGSATVARCVIGPNVTVANGTDVSSRGIWVNGSANNLIGGPGDGNVISGNATGIAIEGAGATGNVVQANTIGLAADGTIQGNTNAGVRIALGANGNQIGATSATGRNVISGNGDGDPTSAKGVGVRLTDVATQGNKIQGNYIGTDASGTQARPNGAGVLIEKASHNTIGGTAPGAGNVVSGNAGVGIDVHGIDEPGSKIFGNRVGTTAGGDAALPNASGIRLLDCTSRVEVGPAAANVVSGNVGNGINVNGSDNQQVQGNLIGVGADGTSPLGNGKSGVMIASGNDNVVGGGGVGNVIGYNAESGVTVMRKSSTDPAPLGNRITGNVIFANGGRGIDLGGDGFTPNDADDADTGPNGFQNFPDLTPLVAVGATMVTGSLESTPSTTFTVEVFSNADCPDGNGQGQVDLGSLQLTTDAAGHAALSLSLAQPLPAASVLTATATAPDGSTSEFSPCTAPVGATATTTTTTTTRPPHTTTTAVVTTTTSPERPTTTVDVVTTTTAPGQSTTTVPAGGGTTTTLPPGPCPPDATFVALECRLAALGTQAGAVDVGPLRARLDRRLERAGAATHDADRLCRQGRVRPARARLRRAVRLVSAATAMLGGRSEANLSPQVTALAGTAGAIRADLRALRLQLRCQ